MIEDRIAELERRVSLLETGGTPAKEPPPRDLTVAEHLDHIEKRLAELVKADFSTSLTIMRIESRLSDVLAILRNGK